jgi:hypothetical protein
MTLIAVVLLSAWAWRQLSRTPKMPASTVANCTQDAIRAVRDPVERAILSGQCAKQVGPAQTGRP